MKNNDYKKDWMNFDQFKAKYQKVSVSEYPNNVLESMPEPKVSVLLITYQHKEYFRDAIESILMQQTDFPFEIVIGDDDSTDGTRELCIEYAQKYPGKIRCFLHKNENKIRVLDKPCGIFQITYGLFSLRGAYIAFLSGDDYWTDPHKLQKQYDFLSNNPEYSMCNHPQKKLAVMNFVPEHRIKRHGKIRSSSGIITILARNICQQLPYQYTEVINEDTFLVFILSTHGVSKCIDTISPAVYRVHGESMFSSTAYLERRNHKANCCEKIYEVFKNSPYRKAAIKKKISAINIRRSYLFRTKNDNQKPESLGRFALQLHREGLLFEYIKVDLRKKMVEALHVIKRFF